jgi:iron complex transport system substrate-binding protein
MFKKIAATILSALLVAGLAAGCANQAALPTGPSVKEYPVTIGDVTISKQPAGAVVLSPNTASVILALGYETQLKAKSADCTQSDLSVLPNVTADDADKIKQLGADLVFTDTALTQSQKDAMSKDGITVLTLKPATGRDDLARLYSQAGKALMGSGTGNDKGQKIAKGTLQTLDDITRMVPQSTQPVTAAYLYDANGSAATGDTLQGKLIESAGFTNVASSNTENKYSVSELLIANPQYIFCAKGVKDQLAASADAKKLVAVQKGKVFEMDNSLMQLQGSELVDAVSFMAGSAYPELLQNTSSSPSKGTSSSASSSAASSGLNLNQTIKFGMQGDDVMKMQKRLQVLGYMFVAPSGLYAEATQQSVKDFQYLNGITVTGVADPATLQKMFSDSAQKRPPESQG